MCGQAVMFLATVREPMALAYETHLRLPEPRLLTIDAIGVAYQIERVAEAEDRRAAVEPFENWSGTVTEKLR
ncbi:MAG: hypothetical protein QOJ59_4945 [Thermomicrobiales bacterium]|nr:hypothetical protein [Thermomicrobiales bacterium]